MKTTEFTMACNAAQKALQNAIKSTKSDKQTVFQHLDEAWALLNTLHEALDNGEQLEDVPENPLREAISTAAPYQVRELAAYIIGYLGDIDAENAFTLVDVENALEAFGGGA